jgi:glycosyltransferase involved in cell wall biosynthesis
MGRQLRVAVTLEQCWHEVPGGTARAALDSVAALVERDDIELVGVAARHRRGPAPDWRPSVPVEMLPLPRSLLYESWHALRRPRVERATGPVDVIHATGMAVPPHSRPLVVTVHDLAFLDHPAHVTRHGLRFFRRAIELAKRDADVVVAPSRATIEDCVRHGFDRDRLRMVPWGVTPVPVDPSALERLRAVHRLDGRYVLWAGTVEPRKNLPGLVRGFAQLDRDDVLLVLAGPDGWNEDLDALLPHSLRPRVRRIGFVSPSELHALYAGASVFCLPSLAEGFGLPVLEAMAQATPVVTSSGTATQEVVGETGVLVDPHRPEQIAEALDRVLGDAGLAEQLAEAGRARAKEFTWDRTAALLVDAYRVAADRHPRS